MAQDITGEKANVGLDQWLYVCEPDDDDPRLGPWPENPDFGTGRREDWTAKNELVYWRKTNAVHRFFVEECADGIDDCEPVYVHPEKLTELYQKCQTVLENPILAHEVLPTRGGFFFGTTDYDEWYFNDLKETCRALEDKVFKNPGIRGKKLYYEASW